MKKLFDPTLITRLSLGGLALALAAGVFVAGTQMSGSADESPAAPSPRKTAYVDFMSLLKNDQLLLAKRFEMAQTVQTVSDSTEARFAELIQQERETLQLEEPDTWQYIQALRNLLDLEAKRYEELLLTEQMAHQELRDFGIERFREIRNLITGIAAERGYNEVLNIVRNVEDVGGRTGDNFESLQQQLLVSPVLYFDEAHDITEIVSRAADERWGTDLNMPGPVTFTLEDEDQPVERNADDELEIRFGQKGSFHTDLADGETILSPDDDKAELRWSKAGIRVGDLSEDGTYVAPDEWPPEDDVFIVTVRSAEDPTVNQNITIRLLNKDGQTRSEEEKAAEDADETEAESVGEDDGDEG